MAAPTSNPTPTDPSLSLSPYRPDGKLYGFICIVTPANTPIGHAIVHELATHGAACIYACTPNPNPNPESTQTLLASTATRNTKTKIIPYPLAAASDEQETLALIDEVLNTWGRLDVFTLTTHNQTPQPQPLTLLPPKQLSTLLSSALHAPFHALKYAPPAMGKTSPSPKFEYPNAAPKGVGYGSIIVVVAGTGTGDSGSSSGGGGGGDPLFTLASHAALGVVRAGVPALRGSGVRVNCVCAPEFGGKGKGTPEEVARVVGFLASGFSSLVSGANLVVDGGAGVGGLGAVG